jgi:para-nitrobenzyl esterase
MATKRPCRKAASVTLRPIGLLLIIMLAAMNCFAAETKSFGTLAETGQGAVDGLAIADFQTVAWLGIPYASPPVGNLRWKAPQDPSSRGRVLNTRSYGRPCSQGGTPSSENCLYLNIWRPDTSEQKLPVFVYIHGGSNIDGSGEGSWYTVAHHYNVVVVTFNYRLGPMGWFLHPALLTGDPKNDSGDFGTLDQIKALEWVQKNIDKFGGDRANVTLVGASAGAQNVTYLMHSPLAKDLFQKAIIESNYPGIRPASAAYKSSKQVLYNLLVADGIAPNAKAAKIHVELHMTEREIRDYLYGKKPAEIAKAYFNADRGDINWGDLYRDDIVTGNDRIPPPLMQAVENRPEFVYAIGDGHVLPKGIPFADFSEGHVFPKPMIVGTTKNENNMWNAYWPFNFQEGKSLSGLVAEAVRGTNPAYQHLQKFYDVFGQHNADAFKQNYKFATELIDEVDTYLGSQMPARHMAAIKTAPKVPIYVYRFDWGSDPNKTYKIPFEDAWVFYNGSIHVSESDFFYQSFFGLKKEDTLNDSQYTAGNLEGRKALSLAIKPYLNEFLHDRQGRIATGAGQHGEWKPWSENEEQFIVFDADYAKADVHMSRIGISRKPEELYAAHAANRNEAVRDFIEYYVLWAWHWNWYPNSTVGHFDTSPGPNPLFNPAKP